MAVAHKTGAPGRAESGGKLSHTYGRFVWRELMAKDVEVARRFYGGLFGWTTQAWEGEQPYHLFQSGGKSIGGLMAACGETPFRSQWTSYVSVPDVDACVERAKSADGTIHHGPVDIPTVGRIAVIADPNGAVTAAFRIEERDPQEETPPCAGQFCWESLQTPDPKADIAFYSKVYGWSDSAAAGAITLGVGEGMMNQVASVAAAPAGVPAHWTSYVFVDSLSKARDRAKSLGARVLVEAVSVPTIGTFAILEDPENAVFCLFEPQKGA